VGTLQNFTAPATIDELRWDDIFEGTGAAVNPGAQVTIHYTGALASDGTIFDSSQRTEDAKPVTFPLEMLIEGWQKGIPGMKVGGKRRLFIPYSQGYGEQGAGGIPPKADIVFDIELFATEGGTPS
jgi:FKBP-type peptidyl-prolyl cis-trans isomerase